MPHSVTSLPAQTVRTTIVMDNLQPEPSKSLARQMNRIFRSNEYLYLTNRELSVDLKDAPEIIQNELYQRISVKRSLIDTGYKFTLAFFEEIQSLDTDRLDAILSFIHDVKQLLDAPGLEIRGYLCICKERQNTAESMIKLDACVERLMGNAQENPLQIVLIDALPLKDVEIWIRAAVRALNVFSRDNELSGRFKGEFYRNTIWNWTLTEFDVDARDENEKETEELKRLLYWDGAFPVSVLQQNFKSLVDTIQSRLRSEMNLPVENVPIPANVIGCCLRKRSLQPNADAFSKQLEQVFLENVTKRVISSIAAGDANEYCRLLLGEGEKQIPLNSWSQVESELEKLTDRSGGVLPKSLEDYPRIPIPGLSACSKVEKMREQIREALNKCVSSLKAVIPVYVKLMLLKCIGNYIREEEPRKRRQIEDKLHTIDGSMSEVQDAADYLQRLGELNEKASAIRMLDCHSQNVYLLISDRTFGEWNALYDEHLHLPHCEVFNYHSLEEFEFQSLMLTTWDKGLYEKNRERFFRQDKQAN